MSKFSIKNCNCTPYRQYIAAEHCTNVVIVALVLEGVIELTAIHASHGWLMQLQFPIPSS